MRILPICLLSLAVLATAAEAQTLYRWVDKNGKVTYSDQPPPKDIKKVDKPQLKSSTIETSEVPFSAQKASQDFPVTLYTAADCKADCDLARAFLRKRFMYGVDARFAAGYGLWQMAIVTTNT